LKQSPIRRIEAVTHPKFVVLTGGPGAGKTALLEVVRRHFCEHVVVLPEAASIVFGGGFPRRATDPSRRAAQRAIFYVQRELERMAQEDEGANLALCDRGTLDGLAYWPGESYDGFLRDVATSVERELARYAMVIHLRTPPAGNGYNHRNPLRTESAAEAHRIDDRIAEIWSTHPRRVVIESTPRFLDKVRHAIELLRTALPPCEHTLASAGKVEGPMLEHPSH
jgi:predicted ATPase